jgi:cytochrome bd-type quinol oxidase subunit 2
VLRWSEKSDEPHNEKYLLLIAYLIGLSVGVHLLAVLTIFPVLMIVYFKRYEFSRKSFIRFGIISVITFFVIYPGVVQFLPSMLDGEFKGIHSDILPFIPPVAIIAAAYGVFRATQKKQKILQVALLSFLLIVFGYTTYILVIMRANVDNLPMNENSPHDLAGLVSYIGREQYGDTPMLKGESWDNEQQGFVQKYFPRRWSPEEMHRPTRENYKSDGDFFWNYQTNHMFLRYVFWNFVGAEGDWQDAGVGWKDTWGIPLFVSLFGIYFHFKKDWKMALTFLAMFIIMGVVLAWYQNQQDPQPRERDYFYVGAYYVIAIWIGLGIVGLIDLLRKKIKEQKTFTTAASGFIILSVVAIPLNLLRVNWHEHDRSHNYIAWDYSYNLLQSCEPNSILFTNGDNDTFPLWYLQDVEGVRRDVRIVNLSLVNTSWYIKQLKNQMPHGTPKVPISLSDGQIDRITPRAWKPQQLELPVSSDIINRYDSVDRPRMSQVQLADSNVLKEGKITFTMNGIPYQQDVRILRVQDILTWEIIRANRWERPIHFAVTCSPDSKIGLDNYLWMQGLTYKLKPRKVPQGGMGIDYDIMANQLMAENVTPTKTPQLGYLYRELNDPSVYYDENVQRMVMNYRFNFIRLAEVALREKNNRDEAKRIMKRMEEIIPIDVVPNLEMRISAYVMNLFNQLNDTMYAEKYSKILEVAAQDMINKNRVDAQDPSLPYQVLLDIYDRRKNYSAALDLMNQLTAKYPGDPQLKSRIQFYEQMLKGQNAVDSAKPK